MGLERMNPGALAGATGARDTKADKAGGPEDSRSAGAEQAQRIIVRPLDRGNWAAETGSGEPLVVASRTPFLDAARVMIALGMPPSTPVTMAHAKRPGLECFLPIALGIAARLSVEEGDRSARLRTWRDPAERLRTVGANVDLGASRHAGHHRATSEREAGL